MYVSILPLPAGFVLQTEGKLVAQADEVDIQERIIALPAGFALQAEGKLVAQTGRRGKASPGAAPPRRQEVGEAAAALGSSRRANPHSHLS